MYFNNMHTKKRPKLRFGSAKKIGGSVRFEFDKNSWFGRFLICVRKRPKFRFGVRLVLAGSVRQKNRRFGSIQVRQKFLVRSFPNAYIAQCTYCSKTCFHLTSVFGDNLSCVDICLKHSCIKDMCFL